MCVVVRGQLVCMFCAFVHNALSFTIEDFSAEIAPKHAWLITTSNYVTMQRVQLFTRAIHVEANIKQSIRVGIVANRVVFEWLLVFYRREGTHVCDTRRSLRYSLYRDWLGVPLGDSGTYRRCTCVSGVAINAPFCIILCIYYGRSLFAATAIRPLW